MKTNETCGVSVFVPGQVWTTDGDKFSGLVMVVGVRRSMGAVYVTNVSKDSIGDAQFKDRSGTVLGVDASLYTLDEGDLDVYQYTVDSPVYDAYMRQMSGILGAIPKPTVPASPFIERETPSGSVVEETPSDEQDSSDVADMPKPVQVVRHANVGNVSEPEATFVYGDGTEISYTTLRESVISRGYAPSMEEAEFLAKTLLGHKPILPMTGPSGKNRKWDYASTCDFLRLFNSFGTKVVATVYNYPKNQAASAYHKLRITSHGNKAAETYPDEILA